ncbi:MAG TPA: NAD(P)(+) transhydrogenase (Re/Si-specific) subunit beta, partial [Flavisolibacter sp.]|nr:NAD(P)(+) transhydrogenase (Re/Si-specific) subunit beta [Flavisolibacter sp.]
MEINVLTFCYIIASVTFIVGLKMLSHPETARRGNLTAAVGMTLAIIGTIFLYRDKDAPGGLHNFGWIFAGIAIGATIGTLAAKKVKMTAMPEMVSLFNGMGGACAALISLIEFGHLAHNNFQETVVTTYVSDLYVANNVSTEPVATGMLLIILLGLIIGSISFAGSVIAWGKLNGSISDYAFKGQHLFNLAVLVVLLLLATYIIGWLPLNASLFFYLVFALALLYGVFFVLPIGGADMPVVISLLNSFTGVAAACGGFLYNNKVMLTGG